MNRQTIPPQSNPTYTNGHYETPQDVSGVSLHRPATVQEPTVFAPELPLRGVSPVLYALHRFHFGGAPVARYLSAIWLALAVAAYFGLVPGGWITIGLAIMVWIGQIVWGIRTRQRHYVSFEPATVPALNSAPLDTSEKLPIYATGLLGVEGRDRPYSAVPGFYRTFATGEHAILCRVADRKWLGMCHWPDDETGMWYAFVNPNAIEQLAWGKLHFGATTLPGIAIQYQLELPAGPRRKKPERRQETLYLATPKQQDAQRVFIDLLTNLPQERIVSSASQSD